MNEGVGIASIEHTACALGVSTVKGGPTAGTAVTCRAEGGGASNKSEGNDLHSLFTLPYIRTT